MIAGYVIAASLYLLFVAFLAVMPVEWIMAITRSVVAFSITTHVIGQKDDVAIVKIDYTWYGAVVLGAWNATVKFACWLRSV